MKSYGLVLFWHNTQTNKMHFFPYKEQVNSLLITSPKFCHMLKISQPIITLMSPYLHDRND